MTNLSLLLFLVIKLYLWELSLTFEYSPVVQTTKGPVKGRVFITIRESKRYHSYRGIPFAKPPLGYLKFAGPEEPNAWKEVFDASKEGNICPQIIDNKFMGKEDCLQLNVYTPQLPENGKELKAVACWIFGGAFIYGENSKNVISPDYLIEEDLVVVSMNYRLGALGFLALEHKNASGNAALKDQNFALKWIRDNIKNFGGDPKKVTLMGESAGAVSVGYHILSEKSKDLFRNTILMSGVPLCWWAYDRPEYAKNKAIDIAWKLGFNKYFFTTENLLDFYYHVDIENLTKVVSNYLSIGVPLKPVLEDPHYATNAFLSECSLKKYKSGDYNHGPLILGYTKNEMLTFINSIENIKEIIHFVMTFAEDLKVKQSINRFYSSLAHIKNGFTTIDELIHTVVQFTSDGTFIAPINYIQRLLSKFNDSIYFYRYDFDYDNSIHKINGININGSAHGDDLVMIFYSDKFQIDPNANNSITLLQKRMTRMWANMVKYGNPTPNGTNDNLLNIVWPDSRNSGKMLWLNDELEIHDRHKNTIIDIFEYGLKYFSDQFNGCDINYNNNSIKDSICIDLIQLINKIFL